MRIGWRSLAVRIVAALLLVLAVGAGGAVVSARIEAGLARRVAARQRKLLAVQSQGLSALLDLVDMETAVRGYALTGRKDFLAPYYSGLSDLRRNLGALQSAPVSSAKLRRAAQAWLQGFAQPTLAAVAQGGKPLAQARGAAWQDQGKSLFDHLRAVDQSFLGAESAYAYRAIAADAAVQHRAEAEIAFAAVLIELLVLLLVYFLLAEGMRSVLRLRRALPALRPSDDLVRLTGGPPEVQQLAREIGHFAVRATEERARLADELAQARTREQEARVESAAQERLAQLRTDFLANMSHELRTPLNSVIGFSDLLLDRGGLDPRQERYARNILDSGHHLLELVNDLLDMAKIDAGRLELFIQECDAGTVAQEAVVSVAPQMDKKDLRHVVQRAGDVRCLADPDRLRQALLNLLSNAYKFTDPGGEVELSIRDDGESVRIAVRDTGRGIPADRLEDIFNEFTQVSQGVSRVAEGTGLGLALTRRLVHMMDGEVTVESTVGEGSTFTITLPALQAISWSAAPGRRVLIVEDDLSARDLVAAALDGMDIRLRWASSGAMAQALAAAGDPDLLILDIVLPDGSGQQVLERLQRQSLQFPAIVVSIVERPHPLPPGVVEWFEKPFAAASLRGAVEKALSAPKGEG